jgi:hypothetical protein
MSNGSVDIIDPCNRTGKITVPMEFVEDTRGLVEARALDASGRPKDLSLCLLFQRGRCNAGARCHQIHVQSQFIERMRTKALMGRTCCAEHGDYNSLGLKTSTIPYVLVTSPEESQPFDVTAFAETAALAPLLSTATRAPIRVSRSKICRLHLQGRCKFGRDCKNVHLCPEARPITVHPLASLRAAVPKATSTEAKAAAPIIATPPKIDASFTSTSSAGGLSNASTPTKRSPSSSPDAPRPLVLEESLMKPLITLKTIKSPTSFAPDGYESTLSLLLEDLSLLENEQPEASPQWGS